MHITGNKHLKIATHGMPESLDIHTIHRKINFILQAYRIAGSSTNSTEDILWSLQGVVSQGNMTFLHHGVNAKILLLHRFQLPSQINKQCRNKQCTRPPIP
jgi:hypothetical protein